MKELTETTKLFDEEDCKFIDEMQNREAKAFRDFLGGKIDGEIPDNPA